MNQLELEIPNATVASNPQGETFATLPIKFSTSTISCSGSSCLNAGVCGYSLDSTARVSPGVAIKGASVEAVMKVVSGTGENDGKSCFQVEGVAITNPGKIVFADIDININGLDFSVPATLLNDLWEQHVKLDQVAESLEDQFTSAVKSQLASAPNLCFGGKDGNQDR